MNKKGFTLVEFLVVIFIIAILVAIALILVSGARISARDAERVTDIDTLRKALAVYDVKEGGYPSIITSGQSLTAGSNTYLGLIPTNPTPQNDGDCIAVNYNYTQDSSGTSYHIAYCLGSGAGDIPAGNCIATPLDMCIACTIDCAGKECGDDGCGGLCGVCGPGDECTDGSCGEIPPPVPPP
ncbi:MAG: prepilin-type N-terminal cleavage/methylation domain-containing protein [bacterium]